VIKLILKAHAHCRGLDEAIATCVLSLVEAASADAALEPRFLQVSSGMQDTIF
jgi:hypothetical protein